MISFKRFDWIFQLILIVGLSLFFLVNQGRFRDFDFMAGYFIVGGWQIVSILVHFFFPKEARGKLRTYHGILSLLLIIIPFIILAVDEDSILGFFVVVLFVTPALAILYLIACFLETKALLTTERPQISQEAI